MLISGDNDCFCRRDPDGFSVSVSILCTEIHTSLKADGKSILPCARRGAWAGMPLSRRPSGQLGTDEARALGPQDEGRELDARDDGNRNNELRSSLKEKEKKTSQRER